jgi:glucokinase
LSIILADLGGTNLRLAKASNPTDIAYFKIKDYPSFEGVLEAYDPTATELFLASAITPLNGIIEDKRFSEGIHWRIDLNALGRNLKVHVLNDLEAAAYGLINLPEQDKSLLLPATKEQTQFDHPPKLLIGVGTGIGHAFLFEKNGAAPFVQRTHGGHVVAFGITKEQQNLIALLKDHHKLPRDLIMENIISGSGLLSLMELIGKPEALRFFWEFLGLYCNTLATLAGAYGGVYLTGGVMEDLVKENAVDVKAFETYFRRPLVDSVVESLASTPIYHTHSVNLAIMGLSERQKALS